MEDKVYEILKDAQVLNAQKETMKLRIDTYKDMLKVAENSLTIIESRIAIENAEYENNKILYPGDPDLDEKHEKALEELEKEKAESFQDLALGEEKDLSPEEKVEKFREGVVSAEEDLKKIDAEINALLDKIRKDPEMAKIVDEKILKEFKDDLQEKKKKRKELKDKKDRYERFIAIINGNKSLKNAYATLKTLQKDREKLTREHKKAEKELENKEKRLEELEKNKEKLSDSEKEEYTKLEEEVKKLRIDNKEQYKEITGYATKESEQANIIVEGVSNTDPNITKEEIWDGIENGSAMRGGKVVLNPTIDRDIKRLDKEIEFDEKVVDRIGKVIDNRNNGQRQQQRPPQQPPQQRQQAAQQQRQQPNPQQAAQTRTQGGVNNTPGSQRQAAKKAEKKNLFQRIKEWIKNLLGLSSTKMLPIWTKVEEAEKKATEDPEKASEIEEAVVKEATPLENNPEPIPLEPIIENPEPEPRTKKPEPVLHGVDEEPEEEIDEPTEELNFAEIIQEAIEESDNKTKTKEKEDDGLNIASFMNKHNNDKKPEIKGEKRKATFIDVSGKKEKESDDGLDIPDWVNKKRNDDDDMEP